MTKHGASYFTMWANADMMQHVCTKALADIHIIDRYQHQWRHEEGIVIWGYLFTATHNRTTLHKVGNQCSRARQCEILSCTNSPSRSPIIPLKSPRQMSPLLVGMYRYDKELCILPHLNFTSLTLGDDNMNTYQRIFTLSSVRVHPILNASKRLIN
jgi:hypothetical protein